MLVRVLGATSLRRGDGWSTIGSRAVRSLLAGLASRAGSPVSTLTLTGWVWGEDLPERPQAALQTVVSRLRRTLRESLPSTVTVDAVPGGYVLRIDPDLVDAARFEALVRQARESCRSGDTSVAVARYEEALRLWDGEHALLDVTPGAEATAEAGRLGELHLAATHDRIELLLGSRPDSELLDELAGLTSRHPLRESFARQYMTALDSAGRRGDALEAYRRLDRALRDELGVGPDPATRALHALLLTDRPLGVTGTADAPADTPGRWPVRVGTPPALAAAFQLRAELRSRVRRAWSGESAVVITQVLAGDGGVGKTQLAASLFHDALESSQVDLGVWVTATSRDAVLAAYAAAFKLVDPCAGAEQEPEAAAAAFVNWLSDTERPWLVVLDDVADPSDLNGLRPRGRSGRVLVTTRRRDAATTALGTIVDVGLFSPDDALAYLYQRLSQPQVSRTMLDGAEQLAADLGHLPLALAQAAAVIIDDAISCSDYRAMLTDRTLRLSEVFPADPRASGDDYAHALPAAWSLATEHATAADPLVTIMLRLVAVLDPNGIPEHVLLTPPVSDYLGARDPATGSRQARTALRAAHKFSLLTHGPDDSLRSVRMHALAQRAALDQLTDAELDHTVRTAADALLAVWPREAVSAELSQAMRDNARALADRRPDSLRLPHPHPVLVRAGLDIGQTTQARAEIEYHAQLVARRQRSLGPDHPSTLEARVRLSDARESAGDVLGAIRDLEGLLADQTRLLGPDHRETLSTRQSLSYARGEAGEAVTAHRELAVLADTCIRLLGPTDPLSLAVRIDTAYWQMETGDVRGALPTLSELVTETVLCGGADSTGAAYARHHLARAHGLAGDIATAIDQLTSLSEHRARLTGPASTLVVAVRRSLAHWKGKSGDVATAVTELEKLTSDALRYLGAEHAETLEARAELAHWRGEAGDVTGALDDYDALLADVLRRFGPDHPLVRKARAVCPMVPDEYREPERGR